jgi:hypothetical protein
MLIGYGLRAGGAGRAFGAIGSLLVSSGSSSLATAVGVVLHLAAMLACGVIYVALVDNAGENRFAWAIAIGGAAAAIVFVLARTLGGSIALVLTPGNLVAIGAVIAITLPIGMRLAPSRV